MAVRAEGRRRPPAPRSAGALLLAAVLPLRPSVASGLRLDGDASALVQVEVLIADVARRSNTRHETVPAELRWPESGGAPPMPIQLHSVRSTRVAASQGTFFDLDLRYNFSASRVAPTDPAMVDLILRSMREYTAVAVDFAKTASSVMRDLNTSTAHGFTDVRDALCKAMEPLDEKVTSFQNKFISTLSSSISAMPGPMHDAAVKTSDTVKNNMRDFAAPFTQIKDALRHSENGTGLCGFVSSKLAEIQKHAKVLVVLNRQQAVGSTAMLQQMPETWKPWVNVSLVREMGGMAAQTADSVESSTQTVASGLSEFVTNSLQCTSAAPPVASGMCLLLFCILALGLGWL